MVLDVYCREAVTHGDLRSWEDFAGETGTVFAVKPQHESRAMSKKRGRVWASPSSERLWKTGACARMPCLGSRQLQFASYRATDPMPWERLPPARRCLTRSNDKSSSMQPPRVSHITSNGRNAITSRTNAAGSHALKNRYSAEGALVYASDCAHSAGKQFRYEMRSSEANHSFKKMPPH